MVKRLTTKKQREEIKKSKKIDKLIEILIEKGIITKEDLK